MKKLFAITLALLAALMLASCNKEEKADPDGLKYGQAMLNNEVFDITGSIAFDAKGEENWLDMEVNTADYTKAEKGISIYFNSIGNLNNKTINLASALPRIFALNVAYWEKGVAKKTYNQQKQGEFMMYNINEDGHEGNFFKSGEMKVSLDGSTVSISLTGTLTDGSTIAMKFKGDNALEKRN